jgi:gamma-glutamylcyclotransferase (GGCT)/AIG2-like uncharacterized protein YtfP
MAYVFVYGTLMSENGNNRILQEGKAQFIAEATTVPNYRMWCGGFPMIMRSDGKHSGSISGEVWLVNPETLVALDRLEGEGRMYERKPTLVRQTDGKTRACHVYLWLGSTAGLREIHPDKDGKIEWKSQWRDEEFSDEEDA